MSMSNEAGRGAVAQEETRPVALVTGGTSGIGRATALAFARAGAKVVLTGRREDAGATVAAEIRAEGGDARFVRADQKDRKSSDDIAAAVAELGELRWVFNNAGTAGKMGLATDFDDEDYADVFDTNVRSIFRDLSWQIPLLVEAGGGAIVNNSSIAARVGMPGTSIYSASKGALDALTRSVAMEVAARGIRVNAVAPGGVRTPGFEGFFDQNEAAIEEFAARHPIGRVASPDEIAGLVVWLCSDAASFVTGQVLVADGGYSVP